MRTLPQIGLFLLATVLIPSLDSAAAEWSGYLAAEGRLFPEKPLFDGQKSRSVSLAAEPEFYHAWEGGSSFTAVPFLRLDSADSERSHFDLRELFFLWVRDEFEVGLGIRKVFWGVTESQHLVDIINQTDLVEYPDGEDKLGQPMASFSAALEWGTVDLYVMPYFRERTFPGKNGRLRSAWVVDTDRAGYENGLKERHPDVAARYSRTIGDWDIGLSHFRGTGREPTLLPGTDDSGEPVLIPFYVQITQTGLDLSWVAGEWLWKLESIYRTGQEDPFFAWTGGFEYTFVGILGSRMDLGVIGEWLHDTRGRGATTDFENDVMTGLRLAVNDPASTEILIGLIQDLDTPARLVSVEAGRRIGESFKLEVEGVAFAGLKRNDNLYSLRNDDFVQVTLAYYY
jgi:hypothetical protein